MVTKKKTSKVSVFKVYTDQMINSIKQAIEDGTGAPWHKPWTGVFGEHQNAISGHIYATLTTGFIRFVYFVSILVSI